MSSFGSRPGLNTTAEAATLTALNALVGGGAGTAIAKNADGSFSIIGVETPAVGITIGTTVLPGGTVGSILFIGTGSVVQQSNANLFWDNTNQRLGIGTTAPTTALTLNGAMTFTGSGTFNTTGATSMVFKTNGTTALTLDSSQNAQIVGKVTSYGGVSTTGWGVPAINGYARPAAGQTGSVASVATYTVGAADGSFIVSANVLVTTSTTHSFTVTCAYTDEGNTSRTVTFNVQQLGGTLITSITNVTGAGPYEGVPLHIRAKASTSITIATTGTFTTVAYNVEGSIIQIA